MIYIKIIAIILLGFLSGYLYRLGGDKNGNKQFRRIGVPLCGLLSMFLSGYLSVPWYWQLMTFGLAYYSMTTYFDWVFGYDNYWVHGLFANLVYMPYIFYSGLWIKFIILCLVSGAIVGLWSLLLVNDVWEERGRGFFLNIFKIILIIR